MPLQVCWANELWLKILKEEKTGKTERQKREIERKERKTVVYDNPTNINFLLIFAIFDSTKSDEDIIMIAGYLTH